MSTSQGRINREWIGEIVGKNWIEVSEIVEKTGLCRATVFSHCHALGLEFKCATPSSWNGHGCRP